MFALSPGFSILRGIMHSLNLSAELERKTCTQVEHNRSSVIPSFPLDCLSSNSASSTQSFTLNVYDTTNTTGYLCHVTGSELQ